MKHWQVSLTIVVLIIVGGVATYIWKVQHSNSKTPPVNQSSTIAPAEQPAPTPQPAPHTPEPGKPTVVDPIAEFKARITKKFFGTYITPATSPVQPERFTGYHTGVDVEYTDTTTDVPVYAIVDATVVRNSWVSGYGGLLVLKGTINGHDDFILYGHVRQSSLPSLGASVKQGDQVGVLGTGLSHETDGERHHLHFAIYTGGSLDIRGYVQNKSELSSWIDPLSLY